MLLLFSLLDTDLLSVAWNFRHHMLSIWGPTLPTILTHQIEANLTIIILASICTVPSYPCRSPKIVPCSKECSILTNESLVQIFPTRTFNSRITSLWELGLFSQHISHCLQFPWRVVNNTILTSLCFLLDTNRDFGYTKYHLVVAFVSGTAMIFILFVTAALFSW